MKTLNSAWLNELREQAQQSFLATGLPSNRAEDWRYTSVTALSKKYTPSAESLAQTLNAADFADYALSDAFRVVLVNGRFAPELSLLDDLPAGVVVCSLNDALLTQTAILEKTLHHAAPKDNDETAHGFIRFNTAWFTDGVFVHVAAKQVLHKPLQILHIASQEQLATTRTIIAAEAFAELQVVETFIGLTPNYMTNAITEVFVGESAQVSVSKMQCESEQAAHFSGTYCQQARNGRFHHAAFLLGGQLTRSEVHTDLGVAAECELNGLYCGEKRQHLDSHTRIRHNQPHAISRQLYKGVLAARARGVFQGRVLVAEGALKTNSQMNNRNLLLSPDAEADSKPQLEIYNDDVQCSHGVTVGQLDDASIFYLQSRGIDEVAARNVLTFAFANEMIDKIADVELQSLLRRELLKKFPNVLL